MGKTKKIAKKEVNVAPARSVARGELAILGRPEPDAAERDRFLSNDIIKLSDFLYEKKVKTSTVKENLKHFLNEIGDLVGDVPRLFGTYELHEIEISAELTLSGELKLMGFGGAEMEGKGGLKFTIRHTPGVP
jgi:hypothetical protein